MRIPTFPGRLAPFGLTALLAILLTACGSAPQQPPTVGLPGQPETGALPDLMPLKLPPSEFETRFAAAEQALLNFDWMSAEAALDTIPPEAMSPTDRTYRRYLDARIAHLRGDDPAARSLAEAAAAENAHPALAGKIMNFQRYHAEITGDYLRSAALADALLADARSAESAAALKSTAWLNLQRLSDDALRSAVQQPQPPRLQAWLDLALIARTDSITRMKADLARWQSLHPTHPAATPLPGGLSYLLEQPPATYKLALVLPLSGRLAPAGEAIREGFLASYYAGMGNGDPQPELLILDRLRFPSTGAAYRAAIDLGAGLVVGPLTRSAVDELGAEALRPVPVLALNRSEQTIPQAETAMVQFSLAPEDEAQRVATLAFGRGARRALILRPAGAWGDKMERALRGRWQMLGGTIADSAVYGSPEEYAKTMTEALGLNASEKRARDLRARLGLGGGDLEFTPRRRQDIDAFFMLSRSPAEARALKPLLSYYYAGNLPVYATSSIHRGTVDPANADLDGINLVDLPWLLGSNPGLRLTIASGSTGSDVYTRLNALGADAHRLQGRFFQLQAGPDALIRGDTGLLTLDPQLRIVRETELAKFDGGELQPE